MTTARVRFHVQAYDREGTAYEPFMAATRREAETEFRQLVRGADDDPDLDRVFIWPARADDPRTADMSGTPLASWIRPRTPTAERRLLGRRPEAPPSPTVSPGPSDI